MSAQKTLVVVGQGMVGYKLLECLVENGATDTWRVVAFGEEPRAAYDRVSLSTYFASKTHVSTMSFWSSSLIMPALMSPRIT